ncbi:MAG: M23 family metallopeptidase [Deltaproteobacteria bacterium]|nr:M23 family metallopeptidase [Deltaproteobacteria bacterium]
MQNRLAVYLSVIVSLFLSSNFVIPVYGQTSWCGGMSWGLPLERSLKVNRPFNDTKKPKHYGVDYKAVDGDNVLTVADGKVLKIDYELKQLSKPTDLGLMTQGWGRYVVVEHTDGSITLYAHLQEGSTSHLTEKQEITKGTIIGKADTTGGVTGPHLHLEYSPIGEDGAKQDPLPCVCNSEDLAELTLSGPDAPTDGSQYTATGGTEPYTWSISKGSITQTGVVTVSGQCGTATVTVKDNCGTQVTKNVRMTNGVWVLVSEQCVNSDCNIIYGSSLSNPVVACTFYGSNCFNRFICEAISGNTKIGYYWASTSGVTPCDENYCTGPYGPPRSCANTCSQLPNQCIPNYWYILTYNGTKTYEWRCQ